jgi:hypothetical protein
MAEGVGMGVHTALGERKFVLVLGFGCLSGERCDSVFWDDGAKVSSVPAQYWNKLGK